MNNFTPTKLTGVVTFRGFVFKGSMEKSKMASVYTVFACPQQHAILYYNSDVTQA